MHKLFVHVGSFKFVPQQSLFLYCDSMAFTGSLFWVIVIVVYIQQVQNTDGLAPGNGYVSLVEVVVSYIRIISRL